MSQGPLASAEALLTTTTDDELKVILEDYILEKKFVLQLATLNDHPVLQFICKDRDEWEKKHFPDEYKPYLSYGNFEKVRIEYFNEELPDEVTLNLSWENYSCGSYEQEDRNLTIKKSWLWANPEEKPWIKEWDEDLVVSVKHQFQALIYLKLKDYESEILKSLGFEGLVGLVPFKTTIPHKDLFPKIPLVKNWILADNKCATFKLGSLKDILDKEVVVGKNTTTLKNELISFNTYNCQRIAEIFKALELLKKEEENRNAKLQKQIELDALKEKFNNVDIEEIEKLIQLKKELQK